MKLCPNCDFQNDDSLKFCGECGARLEESEDLFIGTTIDRRYVVKEKIAEGGMGAVYRAHHARIDKEIALKILHPELARDKKLLTRFETEARTVAKLRHENIVQVYDTGSVWNTYYIAMDFVEGQDLVDIIDGRGPLSVDEAFSIASQVAEGLDYAHKRGILHRDIKPANIIVDSAGRAVITDFGIAKTLGEKGQTTTGTSIGTPEYMSLEQIKGKELDGRTDVYSLGVVLYEMLTRKSPFRSDTGVSAIANVLSEEAEPIERLRPDLPGWAINAVNKAMVKNRDNRYGSAIEFLNAIREGMGKEPMVIPQPPKPVRKKEPGVAKKIAHKEKGVSPSAKKRSASIAVLSVSIAIGLVVTVVLFSINFKESVPLTGGGVKEQELPVGDGDVVEPDVEEQEFPIVKNPYFPMFRGNPARTGTWVTKGVPELTKLLWKFKTGDCIGSSPCVLDGVVYFGSRDDNLYAVDIKTGGELWRFKTGDCIDSSPCVLDGVVYFGSLDDNLYAVDIKTGRELWRFKTGNDVYYSPCVLDGVVYFGSDDGNLYAVE